MKVSIITATYNSEESLLASIESVNNQSYDDIEHIFIDGASTDNTLKLIEKASTRKKRVFSERDKGIYDALNKGIQKATGDIIGLVHSDDILNSENVISEIVSHLTNNKIDGVYGDLLYVEKTNLDSIVRNWQGIEYNDKLVHSGWMPAHPTLFLKKEIYDKYGDFDISYRIAADYHFILRILKNNDITLKYLPMVMSRMRVGGASNRSLKNILKKSSEDYRALKANEIKKPLLVLFRKNTSKIKQFIKIKR